MQNKIDKTLQSLDGIERAQANPFLFGKIMNRINARRADIVYSGKVVLRYVALTLFLAAINTVTVYRSRKAPSEKMKEELAIGELANEYFISSGVFEY